MVLAERLRAARLKRGLSQKEAAEMLNMKQPTLSGYEIGHRTPDPETLARLAMLYECTTDYFLDVPQRIGEAYSPGEPFPVPIVGVVRAGFGSPVLEDFDGYKAVDMQFTKICTRENLFWLRVKGDSMTGDHICNGDLVLVCRQEDVDSGSIAIVAIDGEEGTVKRIIKKDDRIILQPSNPLFMPEVYVGEEMVHVKIIGRVLEARRDFTKQ
ncbi:MAG TPA: S24 family peptidase [Patescibacteria group bacterium]|nr:S24 family peptidase [Patescibacteria group bacterium]